MIELSIKTTHFLNLKELDDDIIYQLKKELDVELKRRQKRIDDPSTVSVSEVFSNRTAGILHWANIRTVADLKKYDYCSLSRIRGIGHKALKEIEQVKRDFNII